jgi:hypothetical protein
VKTVGTYLVTAAAGMTFWAWAVLEAQARFFHLVILTAVATAVSTVGSHQKRCQKTGRGRGMKKLRAWACLTVAAALALVVGERHTNRPGDDLAGAR